MQHLLLQYGPLQYSYALDMVILHFPETIKGLFHL